MPLKRGASGAAPARQQGRPGPEPSVTPVRQVTLTTDSAPLRWASDNSGAIAQHWAVARADNPTLFDGRIYMATDVHRGPDGIAAIAHPMQFSALTYWRHLGLPTTGFHILFGNIILRGTDGAILMVRVADHNATAGMIGFPGGTFDDADLIKGRLDPLLCCLREGEEETGWPRSELAVDPVLLAYTDHARLAFACIADMGVTAEAGAARVRAFLGGEDMPELAEVFPAFGTEELNRVAPNIVARRFAEWIFDRN